MRFYEPPFTITPIDGDHGAAFEVSDAKGFIGTFDTEDDANTAIIAFGMMRYAQDRVARANNGTLPIPDFRTYEAAAPLLDLPWGDLVDRFKRPHKSGNVYHVDNLFVSYRDGEFFVGDWSGHVTATREPEVLAELVRLEGSGSKRQTLRSLLMLSTKGERQKAYDAARAKLQGTPVTTTRRASIGTTSTPGKSGKDLKLEDLGL